MLTRKDITNIEKAYGLKVAQRHADDATSVNMWVTEMMSQEGNPIILYKQQGEPQPLECNYLSRRSEAKSECGGMPRLTSSTLRVRTNNTLTHNFSIHVEDTEQRRFIKKSGGEPSPPCPPPCAMPMPLQRRFCTGTSNSITSEYDEETC